VNHMMLDVDNYRIADIENVLTPNLVYYRDLIVSNTQRAIELAGYAGRLWPHVKSHKMKEMVKLQQSLGINKFKSATIAETEMLIDCEVDQLVLSYPLVGPNISRFISLCRKSEKTKLWALVDDYFQASLLAQEAKNNHVAANVLLDVNLGMNRTGIPLDLVEKYYEKISVLEGLNLNGLHCYDGHHTDVNRTVRFEKISKVDSRIKSIRKALIDAGHSCEIVIAGGTPAFTGHAASSDFYLSPGPIFLSDYTYYRNIPDLDITPAAVLVTRVISHPAEDIFTIDLGHKGIAADPKDGRGFLLGLSDKACEVLQSEEHWVFKMKPEFRDDRPRIGCVIYVIPGHICPTTALYPEVLVVEKGKICDVWTVTARNRKLSI
jgi:D-serine deaminase-like pyridoxal phosphate-dependent protein